jgi:hypothetical protein
MKPFFLSLTTFLLLAIVALGQPSEFAPKGAEWVHEFTQDYFIPGPPPAKRVIEHGNIKTKYVKDTIINKKSYRVLKRYVSSTLPIDQMTGQGTFFNYIRQSGDTIFRFWIDRDVIVFVTNRVKGDTIKSIGFNSKNILLIDSVGIKYVNGKPLKVWYASFRVAPSTVIEDGGCAAPLKRVFVEQLGFINQDFSFFLPFGYSDYFMCAPYSGYGAKLRCYRDDTFNEVNFTNTPCDVISNTNELNTFENDDNIRLNVWNSELSIKISNHKSSFYKIEVLDIRGFLVQKNLITSDNTGLYLDIPSGLYLVRLLDDKNRQVHISKVIIQKL